MTPRVAVLGATGLVGRTILTLLEERNFPLSELVPLASPRSAGGKIPFRGSDVEVKVAEPDAFEGVDIVLSSAGGSVSKELLPAAAERGAVSVDNTSAFRMDPDVPLVVPEVNGERVADHGAKRIIANPNCSTIQMVLALKPLHDAFGLKRVRVSTYQAVSGAGKAAVEELRADTEARLAGKEFERKVFPRPIAFNPLPQVDVFMDDGDTKEEWKMRVETPKILGFDVPVHATCVRVPVFNGHSEAVWVETEKPCPPDAAREAMGAFPGIEIVDDPAENRYPTAVDCDGRDATLVGRVRRDPTVENGLAFWCVADNLRKGAATNAVQIAERLVEDWKAAGK